MASPDNQEMSIDLGCEILLQFDTHGIQVQGNLIGLENDDFIIVSPKPLSGLDPMVGKGDRAQGLYLCEGTVFAFRSTLIQLIDNPIPLLFLSFPNKVQARPLRTRSRAPAFLPALAKMEDDLWFGALLDLSRDGLRFACAPAENGRLPRPKINDLIEITTNRLATEAPLVVAGKIMNVKAARGYLTLGVKLRQTPAEAVDNIGTYLNRVSFLNESG